MTVPGIGDWLAAACLVLALYIILDREPELLMPDVKQRPWSATLAWFRDLGDRWRGRGGIWADDDDDEAYVRDLHGEEPDEAPVFPVVGRPGVVTVALPFMEGHLRGYAPGEQRPPWEQAPEPPPAGPQLKDLVREGPRAWQSGDQHDPPTLVRGMRALMDDDPEGVGHYVDGLPKYEDD